jgi:hypothetical protein
VPLSILQGGQCINVSHPFNTGYSPLSYSGNPGLNAPYREACLQPLQYWRFTPELQWQPGVTGVSHREGCVGRERLDTAYFEELETPRQLGAARYDCAHVNTQSIR